MIGFIQSVGEEAGDLTAIDFESTTLWQRTLAHRQGDVHEKSRERLRSAYLQFRGAVEPLAEDIKVSMPMFTDHGIAHIDSLWETAGIVMGEGYPINPAEAFVLGGSFLLHDLGMGLVAYPGGKAVIEQDPAFKDLRIAIASDPSTPEESVDEAALVHYLRLKHARQAERLVFQSFPRGESNVYLLQDSALLAAFGPMIGRIAHSHWLDVADLPKHFSVKLGALPELPIEWTIDPLKIACILRVADAAHIDSRRSPMFLHAYRRPTGAAHDHWYFQERLTRPRSVDDRLEYAAMNAFDPDEAPAWWLAYDTIRMINSELRQVDALFADLGMPRFVAKSVVGADSPQRFAKFVSTTNWTPIDASLRVTQVTKVIESLGGTALYGDQPVIGLREIISNAADATRARRIQFGGSELSILVKLMETDAGWILSVRDRGLGMSPARMVKYLTDFGNSQWTSADSLAEYPGLLARGYRPTGRFGIGFFAAFMLADRIQVRSLPFRGASQDTAVLEFSGGLKSRPLLRSAEYDEQLDSGGTEVRLFLNKPPRSEGGLLDIEVSPHSNSTLLVSRLRSMCALLDVDLVCEVSGELGPTFVVRADEWKTLPPGDLYDRCYLDPYADHSADPSRRAMHQAYRKLFIENAEDLLDESGDIVARAALAGGLDELVSSEVWWWPSPGAGVFIGGMEAGAIWNVLGVFVGKPLKADRNSAFPVSPPDTLRAWAESQAIKSRDSQISTPMTRYGAGELARSVGASARDLPCGFISSGMITPEDLPSWLSDREQVAFVSDSDVFIYYDESRGIVLADRIRHRLLSLPEYAIVVDMYPPWIFPDEIMPEPRDERFAAHIKPNWLSWDPAWWWHRVGARGAARSVLDAAARAWGLSAVELGLSAEKCAFPSEGLDQRIVVPCVDGSGTVPIEAILLRRPSP